MLGSIPGSRREGIEHLNISEVDLARVRAYAGVHMRARARDIFHFLVSYVRLDPWISPGRDRAPRSSEVVLDLRGLFTRARAHVRVGCGGSAHANPHRFYPLGSEAARAAGAHAGRQGGGRQTDGRQSTPGGRGRTRTPTRTRFYPLGSEAVRAVGAGTQRHRAGTVETGRGRAARKVHTPGCAARTRANTRGTGVYTDGGPRGAYRRRGRGEHHRTPARSTQPGGKVTGRRGAVCTRRGGTTERTLVEWNAACRRIRPRRADLPARVSAPRGDG